MNGSNTPGMHFGRIADGDRPDHELGTVTVTVERHSSSSGPLADQNSQNGLRCHLCQYRQMLLDSLEARADPHANACREPVAVYSRL